MTIPLRRLGLVLLAATAVAAGGACAAGGPARLAWQPATFGLTAAPASLLPAAVSATHPVRVVSTALDRSGRPVVTVRTAGDSAQATGLVKRAQQARNAVGVEVDARITADAVPSGSDPYRSRQWDLSRMHVAAAWQKSTGAGVTVAVLDTGVDATQPDLAGQVLPGFDAIAGYGDAQTDPNGHGTHVAGIIAADTGNNTGISAIAPDAKILPVRVMSADGTGYLSAAASGIVYATDHGAGVITMSFSSPTPLDAMNTAIGYARSHGVVVVASVGNDRQSGSPLSYPAASDGVIAVAATNGDDRIAPYSSAGSYVDLAAPGSGILSTWPGGGYKTLSGTSMAAPHVAAVAALIRAADPSLAPDEVERIMEHTAQDVGAPGRDNDYGYGRVDAANALGQIAALPDLPAAPVATPSTAPTRTPTVAPTRRIRPVIKVGSRRQAAIYGDDVPTTFTLTVLGKPWARRPVQVCVTATGSAATCGADTTGNDGTVTVLRTANGTYAVRIATTADDTFDAATSPVVTVVVGTRVTLAATDPTTLQVILAGAAGQTVQVQAWTGTRWYIAATYPAEAVHDVPGLSAGRYRVVVPGRPGLTGTTSAAVRIG